MPGSGIDNFQADMAKEQAIKNINEGKMAAHTAKFEADLEKTKKEAQEEKQRIADELKQ